MTHIAGFPVLVEGRYQRQLCAWCGYPLIDDDLARMASEDGSAPGAWAVGALVEVDGPMTRLMADPELDTDSCAIMEITR